MPFQLCDLHADLSQNKSTDWSFFTIYFASFSGCWIGFDFRLPISLLHDFLRHEAVRLYALYNNLLFVNLASFDPGTYNVLIQLKIAMTGVSEPRP